jgi:hypothetical protein
VEWSENLKKFMASTMTSLSVIDEMALSQNLIPPIAHLKIT